ncbi:MAG: ABC transporter permease [Anaerolineaceae bacterium]|nr:ABC transporter permease [Anaerolineaceae bacterium]
MAQFIIRRILIMIPTVFVTSMVAFIIIQLPPGDYLTSYVANLSASGEQVEEHVIEALNERFGLDQPIYVQYLKWISNIITKGDFGQSFAWRTPVENLIWGRLGLTVLISVATLIFTWIIAFPVGIYSAVNKYSLGDYIATFFGFLGLAIPNFLLALVLMYIAFKYFNQSVGGLFSPEYVEAPWSFEKVLDLMSHLWIPMIILGTAGAASLIRIMRANLLDELGKPYVRTARAKGLPEWKVILKYPVRVALNPFVSTAGWLLPTLVSGSIIVATVLSLPTTGPMLLSALTTQDMYLAGAFILLLSILTMVGTLVSDILLAALDPRIRFD